MGGRNMNLMEFTEFDLAALKSGGSTTIWLAQNIPVAPYRNGQLIVRFKTITIATAGSSAAFSLVAVAPTAEDPSKIYRNTAAGGVFPATPLSIGGVITAGTNLLYTKELSTDSIPLPNFVSLRMVVTQATVDTGLNFAVNVDLSLKE